MASSGGAIPGVSPHTEPRSFLPDDYRRWLVHYNGVGEHGYLETHREGPYLGMMACFSVLGRRYGALWVEENFECLALGIEEGIIVWLTDELGVRISDSPGIGD